MSKYSIGGKVALAAAAVALAVGVGAQSNGNSDDIDANNPSHQWMQVGGEGGPWVYGPRATVQGTHDTWEQRCGQRSCVYIPGAAGGASVDAPATPASGQV